VCAPELGTNSSRRNRAPKPARATSQNFSSKFGSLEILKVSSRCGLFRYGSKRLFVFKTPVTEIQLSVSLNFNFRFVTAGSDEADYSFHDLNLRCEPLETEYDDYMTYYQKMEFEDELPSFESFFKKAHYNSDLVFAAYQSKQDFLKDFEQKFVISNAYKQIEIFYNRVFKTMEDTPQL
jgi:hypothetical protein